MCPTAIRLFWLRPRRKHQSEQLLYCCVRIPYREKGLLGCCLGTNIFSQSITVLQSSYDTAPCLRLPVLRSRQAYRHLLYCDWKGEGLVGPHGLPSYFYRSATFSSIHTNVTQLINSSPSSKSPDFTIIGVGLLVLLAQAIA